MQQFFTAVAEWMATSGIKIVISLVLLLIAFKLVNVFSRHVRRKLLDTQKFDETLCSTLTYVIGVALKVLVVISLVGFVGIETSGITAVVGSLGVCVGLAVNGTLSNLAGGVMILITRPFKIGDRVTAMGNEGIVEDIRICHTKIFTDDNRVVYLPNSGLSTGVVVNHSEKDFRRVDLEFLPGEFDPNRMREMLLRVCAECEEVEKTPAPQVEYAAYGAAPTKIILRFWCRREAYETISFRMRGLTREALEKEGMKLP